jgi:photosystem II stability/assembly factor-like uncharacterized protein
MYKMYRLLFVTLFVVFASLHVQRVSAKVLFDKPEPANNSGSPGLGVTSVAKLSPANASIAAVEPTNQDVANASEQGIDAAGVDQGITIIPNGPRSSSVGLLPGDTLYTFRVPSQIILGVAKMGSSNKLAFTSGGQSSGTVADNKWIITDLYGTILDTTHMQINPTTGQGFGFRDLSWDGQWLLCGDDTRLRRIDTATFTELLAPIVTQTNPVRGVANENRNRIWIANFTTSPLRVYDTTGAIVRTIGTPSVAPYGLGWDPWTDPNRAWLWYPQPSVTGTTRLSKVDTSTGAIVQTFDYSAMTPSTTVGGFDIVNDHPDYPGAVIGFMINQGFPNSSVYAIYLGEDSSIPPPPSGWTLQTSGVTSILYSVTAVNRFVAWAAGAGGVVLRTTNGGTNWTSVGGGAIGTEDIYHIEALNANVALATTTPSTTTFIYRTTNGGTSWAQVYSLAGGFINAIHMFDAMNGIAQGDPVGGLWVVIRTTDGGASWARIATEPTQVGGEFGANNGMKVLGTTHIWWTPGTGNGFYRSTDGGATWSRVTLPASGFTAGVDFLNTQIGVVGNSGGSAARTTDGGATWTPVTIGTAGAIYSVSAAGTQNFWATRGTTVQASTNSGSTWAQDFSGAVGTFYHSNFVTAGNSAYGWGVTSSGRIYAYFNPVTGVDDPGDPLPLAFTLSQNYPNPFNPATEIQYSVPKSSFVTLKVYSLLGQEVATLVNGDLAIGNHVARWDGRNANGALVGSGMYFYRMEARTHDGSSFISVKKMLLLK